MNMSEATAWLDRALCNSRNPRLYETDGYRNSRVSETDRVARAGSLCAGCVVLEECAAEALEPLAVATIRAGVWIDVNPIGRTRRAVREQLLNVALGRQVSSA